MNLENNIKDCIQKELEKGIIEKVISQKLEVCISEALDDMFKWNGCMKKTIEKQLESAMIPYLENYNYDKFIPKLDMVMTEVLKTVGGDNKKILENFKSLMITEKVENKIKMSDIFDKWCEYVKSEVDKDNIDYDEYEGACINISVEIEDIECRWGDWDEKIVRFECDEDEKLNIEFKIDKWSSNDKYYINSKSRIKDLKSLRHLSEFDMFMTRLGQACNEIELDISDSSEELYIDGEYGN